MIYKESFILYIYFYTSILVRYKYNVYVALFNFLDLYLYHSWALISKPSIKQHPRTFSSVLYNFFYSYIAQPSSLNIVRAALFYRSSQKINANNFTTLNRLFWSGERFVMLFKLYFINSSRVFLRFLHTDKSYWGLWRRYVNTGLFSNKTNYGVNPYNLFLGTSDTGLQLKKASPRYVIYSDYTTNFFKRPLTMRRVAWVVHTHSSLRKFRYINFIKKFSKTLANSSDMFTELYYILRGANIVVSHVHFLCLVSSSSIFINNIPAKLDAKLQLGDIISFGSSKCDFSYYSAASVMSFNFTNKKLYSQSSKLLAYREVNHRILKWLVAKTPIMFIGGHDSYAVDYQLGLLLITKKLQINHFSAKNQLYRNSHLQLSYWRYNV